LALNSSLPFTASPPELRGAVAAGAAASVAGRAAVLEQMKTRRSVSIKAKLKNKFLEIELWLPTFFIFINDYRLNFGMIFIMIIKLPIHFF
jgi:hypothetical protein